MRTLIVHPTRRATLLTTGLLLFSLILAGCGGGSSSAVPTATATATATATPTATPTNTPTPSGSQASVRMSGSIASGFAFTPATITIKVGTAVVWINATSAPHTSTSDVGSPFAWDTSFKDGFDLRAKDEFLSIPVVIEGLLAKAITCCQ